MFFYGGNRALPGNSDNTRRILGVSDNFKGFPIRFVTPKIIKTEDLVSREVNVSLVPDGGKYCYAVLELSRFLNYR